MHEKTPLKVTPIGGYYDTPLWVLCALCHFLKKTCKKVLTFTHIRAKLEKTGKGAKKTMKDDTVRLNLTVKKESLELFRASADAVNLRPGAFFDLLMTMLASQTTDPEKLLGKFVMEVVSRQSK